MYIFPQSRIYIATRLQLDIYPKATFSDLECLLVNTSAASFGLRRRILRFHNGYFILIFLLTPCLLNLLANPCVDLDTVFNYSILSLKFVFFYSCELDLESPLTRYFYSNTWPSRCRPPPYYYSHLISYLTLSGHFILFFRPVKLPYSKTFLQAIS